MANSRIDQVNHKNHEKYKWCDWDSNPGPQETKNEKAPTNPLSPPSSETLYMKHNRISRNGVVYCTQKQADVNLLLWMAIGIQKLCCQGSQYNSLSPYIHPFFIVYL